MPETKPQSQDDVDEFLKKHPEYKPYFETYEKDIKSKVSDPSLKGTTKEQQIKEKAELNYYTEILNKKLKEKDPKAYDELMSNYGEGKVLSYNTRKTGATEFGKKHPSFYLSPEEQKQVFETNKADWDRYSSLRGKYGKDLLGENEDPDDPENWKVGARHAVLKNQSEYYDTIVNDKNGQPNNVSSFKRTEKWDPNIEGTVGYTEFSNKNVKDPNLNQPNVYLRKLQRVSYEDDNRSIVNNGQGNISREPGPKFYKHFDDGTTQEISPLAYQQLQSFNNAPAYVKNHPDFTEQVDINKLDDTNKKIAQERLDALKQVEDAGQ